MLTLDLVKFKDMGNGFRLLVYRHSDGVYTAQLVIGEVCINSLPTPVVGFEDKMLAFFAEWAADTIKQISLLSDKVTSEVVQKAREAALECEAAVKPYTSF